MRPSLAEEPLSMVALEILLVVGLLLLLWLFLVCLYLLYDENK